MDDEEKLSAMFDGELDPQEQADMAKRVASDAKLQVKLAAMAQADDLIRAVVKDGMSDEIPDRLIKAIDAGLAKQTAASR